MNVWHYWQAEITLPPANTSGGVMAKKNIIIPWHYHITHHCQWAVLNCWRCITLASKDRVAYLFVIPISISFQTHLPTFSIWQLQWMTIAITVPYFQYFLQHCITKLVWFCQTSQGSKKAVQSPPITLLNKLSGVFASTLTFGLSLSPLSNSIMASYLKTIILLL